MFSFLNLFIKTAYAMQTNDVGGGTTTGNTIDVGSITGTGPYGSITESNVGTQFSDIISNVVTVLTVVGGLAFVIFFTLGGLKWLTAGGDKAKVSEAQQQMTQGVIGLVAIVAGLFIVGIIGGILGIDILNPFTTLSKIWTK